ncbi:MAG: sigma-70 family RNA polymerase sigma factor [Oscillospiraceae bacterium]|nr:sigma-70 family RNA polymerase sigma factor [Oscillospiraceae bacterium]
MEDKDIIGLYISRSERAISETDIKYGSYCRTIARNVLNDREETEECVNDTYFSLWKTIPPTIPTILKSFIAKITRNKAINMYEKKTASKRSNGQMEVSIDELTECFASSDDAQSKVERQETIAAINEFLEGLDKNKRIYFVQRYWYLTPIKEIAAKNNISEGSLKTMLSRIRADLKKFITARGLY